jgi:hypothetical protein
MEIVHARCCGLDVPKKSVVACVLISQPDGLIERQVRPLRVLCAPTGHECLDVVSQYAAERTAGCSVSVVRCFRSLGQTAVPFDIRGGDASKPVAMRLRPPEAGAVPRIRQRGVARQKMCNPACCLRATRPPGGHGGCVTTCARATPVRSGPIGGP